MADILQIGWETNTNVLAMQSVDNPRSSGEYYCRLYWAHALTRHYLTTGRKYALIKKYALNKHVRLLTRLYGTWNIINPYIRCSHQILTGFRIRCFIIMTLSEVNKLHSYSYYPVHKIGIRIVNSDTGTS